MNKEDLVSICENNDELAVYSNTAQSSRPITNETFHLKSFCWQNISVSVKQKQEQGLWRKAKYKNIQIVNNVSGFLTGGSLFAIMGPSGSGKTTLLAAISHRLREGVHGHTYVNGQIVSANEMLILSGFAPQDDLTIQSLTVLEHFKIMATLKMDRKILECDRIKKILMVAADLGIQNLLSSYLSDLSGGEQRRLSIAVQMLTNPPILFCDEPTTGLDSANAAVVVKLLKQFTMKGKIVICSIHQPAASIYELFDQLLLLTSGGRVAYFDFIQNVPSYFQKLNLNCPPNYNIAEFLLKNVSITDDNAHERIEKLRENYSTSIMEYELQHLINLTRSNCSLLTELSQKNNKDQMNSLLKYFTIEKPTLITQTYVLMRRSCISLRKNYLQFCMHAGSFVFLGLMLSLIFKSVTLCTENSIQNIRGCISSMLTFVFFEFAYYQFNSLPEEKDFIMREINNGLYPIEAYCLAKLLGKLIVSITVPTIYVSIIRLLSNIYDHISFLDLVFPFVIIATTGTAYGCMLSSTFNNLNVLFVVATGYEMPAYLMSGIALNLNSLPIIFRYLRYVSIFYYSLEYLSVLEWKKASSIQCEDPTFQLKALQFLAANGYDVKNYQKDIWIILSFGISFFIITYGLLRRKTREPVAY